MKEILWIRHAQSIGNAGMPTENRSSFPLSALGVEQAKLLANKIPFTPDLIVASPFRRAWETAAPTSARYPTVKMEIWPEIHEFTYLSPATCVGTTAEDRRPRVKAYWAALDPDYRDGDDAETFRDVMGRAVLAIEHLANRWEQHIILFSHEQFIKCVQLALRAPDMSVDEKMRSFPDLPPIRNCEMIPLHL